MLFSELRYQAGRGDGRGPRGRENSNRSKGTDAVKPGTLGDGDKNKNAPQNRYYHTVMIGV